MTKGGLAMKYLVTCLPNSDEGSRDVTYLSRSGFRTYRLERAALFATFGEAAEEAEWFNARYPLYNWEPREAAEMAEASS